LDPVSARGARRELLARARVHQPKALGPDQPTRRLHFVARQHFPERVRQVAQLGTTIILVTHHAEEIIPEIDRVILLRRGRVAYDGAKSAVLTAARLTDVFDAPVTVSLVNGYFHVQVGG